MTDQDMFYSGADPSFPSEREVTDWAEHNDHADGETPDPGEPVTEAPRTVKLTREWVFRITAEPGTWPDMPTHLGASYKIRPKSLEVQVTAAQGGVPRVSEWTVNGPIVDPDGSVRTGQLSGDRACSFYTRDPEPGWLAALLAECLAEAAGGERMAAATAFVEAWAGIFGDGTVSMTCGEAEAASDLLCAFGRNEAAAEMMSAHAGTDSEGDSHYWPERD